MSSIDSTDSLKSADRLKEGWYALYPPANKAAIASVDPKPVTMSLDNRGLAYGDGFFTTMAVRDGQVLWADYHWQRLASHAAALQLDIATLHLVSSLKAYAQQLQQGVMKVIVTRATQSLRGYSFAADAVGNACEIWLKLMPSEGQSATDQSATHKTAGSHDTLDTLLLPNGASVIQQAPSLAVCLSSQIAVLPPTLAGLKSLNRLDNVLASGELEQIKTRSPDTGIGEGLLRDMSGQWVEGVMSNVFYQLSGSHTTSSGQQEDANKDRNYLTDGQWYTPPMTRSGVAGVMRQVLMDSLAETRNPVIMRSLADNDLPKLSQMFFCNAVRGVMPVSKLTLLSGQVVEFN
ncbi:aminotransferase class IV [uncultured Psychrobacter sp.]|uniref:aminotransferase class IV n=1 Tax=uncultured Psychrobacter sp. TaxID=259303 RepID=UPI002610F1CA|nr:aminotransferase class IV [uncultured Psychrobacter sp.]